ncbi:MAG: hypothetical protein R6U43_04250 [Candidatus Krumholzibacteriales bacterium]
MPVSSPDDYSDIYPGFTAADSALGSGRARIEFENYRFRGKFRFELKGENLRVDFTHSSLMGAVETEGSLFLTAEGMLLIDRNDGKIYRNRECMQMAQDAVGAAVTARDIKLVLQMSYPEYQQVRGAEAAAGKDEWFLSFLFGEKKLELWGSRPGQLERMKISRTDGSWSFVSLYGYGSFGDSYPERIDIANEDGSVRITLKVENYSEQGGKI